MQHYVPLLGFTQYYTLQIQGSTTPRTKTFRDGDDGEFDVKVPHPAYVLGKAALEVPHPKEFRQAKFNPDSNPPPSEFGCFTTAKTPYSHSPRRPQDIQTW